MLVERSLLWLNTYWMTDVTITNDLWIAARVEPIQPNGLVLARRARAVQLGVADIPLGSRHDLSRPLLPATAWTPATAVASQLRAPW